MCWHLIEFNVLSFGRILLGAFIRFSFNGLTLFT